MTKIHTTQFKTVVEQYEWQALQMLANQLKRKF